MAQIIHGGMAAFNALVHGEKPQSASTYFDDQIKNLGRSLTDAGQKHLQTAFGMYQQFNNSDVMRIARAALRKVQAFFEPNCIRSLWDMYDFQVAQPVMQRYVMANPIVRTQFHQQLCDGYSGTYFDYEPNAIAEEHYDYRRVMNGVIVDDEDPNKDFKFTIYLDTLHATDRELTLPEQVDILNTWRRVEMLMELGEEDPTSIYGDKL